MTARVIRIVRDSPQARYLLVGGYNTAVGYAVFALLLFLFDRWLHYTVLLVVAWAISTVNAFVAYRMIVFRVRGHFFRDLARFCSVYVVALGINVVTLPIVVSLTGLPVLVAQGVVVLGTTAGTYTAHKYFSFRRPTLAPGSVREADDGEGAVGDPAADPGQER